MRPRIDRRTVEKAVLRIEKVLQRLVSPEVVQGHKRWRAPNSFTHKQTLRLDAPDGDRVHVDVVVNTARGSAPRGLWQDWGRGEGRNRGGEITITLPTGWVWDADAFESTLVHELAHALDPELHARGTHGPKTTERGGVREEDAAAYVNDPAEIRAIMQSIERDLHSRQNRELIALWSSEGFPWRRGKLPTTAEIVQNLLSGNLEMARVSRFLTRTNRAKIDRMAEKTVGRILKDLGAVRVARRWLRR